MFKNSARVLQEQVFSREGRQKLECSSAKNVEGNQCLGQTNYPFWVYFSKRFCPYDQGKNSYFPRNCTLIYLQLKNIALYIRSDGTHGCFYLFTLSHPPPRLYALYFFPGYLLLFFSGMLTRNIVGISVVHKKACCLILQDWLFGPDWNSFFIHPKFGYFSIEGVANEGKFL